MLEESIGQLIWAFIHVVSMNCKNKSTSDDAWILLRDIYIMIPCEMCSSHTFDYMNEQKGKPDNIAEYTFIFHNHVNGRLGKQQFNMNDCCKFWEKHMLYAVVWEFLIEVPKRLLMKHKTEICGYLRKFYILFPLPYQEHFLSIFDKYIEDVSRHEEFAFENLINYIMDDMYTQSMFFHPGPPISFPQIACLHVPSSSNVNSFPSVESYSFNDVNVEQCNDTYKLHESNSNQTIVFTKTFVNLCHLIQEHTRFEILFLCACDIKSIDIVHEILSKNLGKWEVTSNIFESQPKLCELNASPRRILTLITQDFPDKFLESFQALYDKLQNDGRKDGKVLISIYYLTLPISIETEILENSDFQKIKGDGNLRVGRHQKVVQDKLMYKSVIGLLGEIYSSKSGGHL
jgi:hypothetical protein